jgi:hypothetical protein
VLGVFGFFIDHSLWIDSTEKLILTSIFNFNFLHFSHFIFIYKLFVLFTHFSKMMILITIFITFTVCWKFLYTCFKPHLLQFIISDILLYLLIQCSLEFLSFYCFWFDSFFFYALYWFWSFVPRLISNLTSCTIFFCFINWS